MKHDGFTLLEALIAITLIGVMGLIGFHYLNLSTLSSIQSKSQLQTHITLLSSMVLECKTLSESMPKQIGGADAFSTRMDQLECQTAPTYALDGGRSAFVPNPPERFDPYRATELSGSFFITLSTTQGGSEDALLQSIATGYTSTQASLHYASGKALLDIYLSR